MGAMSITMFLGITLLATAFEVRDHRAHRRARTVLAQIGETVFGDGFVFLVLQVFTAAILILAANTAFQDFPGFARSSLATGFMPSQFRNRGDRLVF